MTTLLASRRSPLSYVGLGGVALGTLDLIFVCAFWGALRGLSPERILQSIAAGVQGPAAFHGGASSAVLGALCLGLPALLRPQTVARVFQEMLTALVP